MKFRKLQARDFQFITDRLAEKQLSFEDIIIDKSFVGITDDEIISYVLISDDRDNLPELLKHTDAFLYKVTDIYVKKGYEDDLSRTSFYLVKALNQYAYLWCNSFVNIPRRVLETAFLTYCYDQRNNDRIYFLNSLEAGTLNKSR